MDGELEFGFVPKQVVDDLQDIGNWKSRATAVDSLQKALRDVQDKSQLQSGLPRFVAFLNTLIADPNFKIAISSLQILADLAHKVGKSLDTHLRSIMASLAEKFVDSKVLVRTATLKALKTLMAVSSAQAVLDHMRLVCMNHSSWKVREQIVNTSIMAAAQHARDLKDYNSVFQLLSLGLGDGKDRVRFVALEGFAYLDHAMTHQPFLNVLGTSSLTANQKEQINQRLAQQGLPTVNTDGLVQHVSDVAETASENNAANDILGVGSARLPWEPVSAIARQRVSPEPWLLGNNLTNSTALQKQPSNNTAIIGDVNSHNISTRPMIQNTSSNRRDQDLITQGSNNRTGYASGSTASFNARPAAMQETVLYPPTVTFPQSTANSSQATTALSAAVGIKQGYATAQDSTVQSAFGLRQPGIDVPPRLRLSQQQPLTLETSGRSGDNSTRSSTSTLNGVLLGSPTVVTRPTSGRHAEQAPVRPSWLENNGTVSNAAGVLSNLRLSTAASSNAETGSEVNSAVNSPLTPSRVYRSLLASNPSNRPPSQGAVADLQKPMQPQQPLSAFSSTLAQAGVLGLSIRCETPEALRTDSPGGPPVTHGLGMWLNTSQLESEQAGPARAEAYSPSKGALLANLKKRQIEKRANSSQMPARPGIDDALVQRTTSPCPNTPKGLGELDGVTPRSDNGVHYGLDPFGNNNNRMNLYGMMDPSVASAVPKTAQLTSIGAASLPHPLQPINSGNSSNHSFGYGGDMAGTPGRDLHSATGRNSNGAAQGIGSVPSSPLGLLATRRNRGLVPTTSVGINENTLLPQTSFQPNVLEATFAMPQGELNHLPTQAAHSFTHQQSTNSPKPGALARLAPQPRLRSADTQNTAIQQTPAHTQHDVGDGNLARNGSGHSLVSHGSMAVQQSAPSSSQSQRDKANSASQVSYWEKGMKPLEELAVNDLTPLTEPEKSCKAAIAKILEANQADRKTMDWQGQHEALNDVRRLVKYHTEVAKACLHELIRAIAPTVDQLRSLCVKNSLMLLQEMFNTLGRAMDKELDEVVPVLLKKAGEVSNAGRENWLAIEADRVLAEMCRCCTEHKVISSLAACAGHKSMHVRAKVASHLDGLLEICSNLVRTLTISSPATLDKLFRCAAGFLDEGALDTRVYGKRIIWGVRSGVASRSEYDRLVALIQPDSLAKKVMDVIDSSNGPPPPPSRGAGGSRSVSRQLSSGQDRVRQLSSGQEAVRGAGPGAYGIVNGVLSGGNSGNGEVGLKQHYSISAPAREPGSPGMNAVNRANAANGGPKLNSMPSWKNRAPGSAPEEHSSPTKSAPSQRRLGSRPSAAAVMSAADSETLGKIPTALGSKDFRARIEGLQQVETLASGPLALATESQITPLLDMITARLNDSNAKVAVAAAEAMQSVILCLRDRVMTGLNTLVPALATALGSSNDKVRSVAATMADTLLSAVDPALLVQHFSHCVTNGQMQRGRPQLVERLQVVLTSLWPARQQLVIKHGVPAAFSLLNGMRGDGKASAQALLLTLATLMGASLMDHAVTLQPQLQQKVAEAILAAANE